MNWKPSAKRLEPPAQKTPRGAGSGTSPNAESSGCKVFVRGFDLGTSEDELVAYLQSAGDVLGIRYQGRRKSSAVVTFGTEEEASLAVGLNGTNIPGNERYLEVKLDNPQAAKKGRPNESNASECNGDELGEDVEHDDANARWREAMAHAWSLFCEAVPPASVTIDGFLEGLPEEARDTLQI